MAVYAATTASIQLKIGPGKYRGGFVSAASSTPKITVYDSATSSTSDPVMILEVVPTVGMWLAAPDPDGAGFTNGLYAVISGTVSVTFYYE